MAQRDLQRERHEAVDSALDALLGGDPDALVVALGEDGFRIDPPDGADVFARYTVIPHSGPRTTMLDLVQPADLVSVIAAWEEARAQGAGLAFVRTLSDPDQPTTLMIANTAHRYGSWIGVLARSTVDRSDTGSAGHDAAMRSRRPRSGLVTKNQYAMITAVDERILQMTGLGEDAFVGQRSLELIHPEDHERSIAGWLEMLSQGATQRIRVRHRAADGWLWVELENAYTPNEDPERAVVVTHVTDVSDEMAAHAEVERRERLFYRLAESLPSGLLQTDDAGRIVYANGRLAQILGQPGAAHFADQWGTLPDEDRKQLLTAFDAILADRRGRDLELEVRLGDGEVRRCLVTLTALLASDHAAAEGTLISVTDVTETARLRDELHRRATYDGLTGCHNRGATMTELERLLSASPPGAPGIAVMFLDLDEFKPINDRFGHAAGDAYLVEAAARLRSACRDGDVVGRLGGDEFLLACDLVATAEEARGLAQRVHEALHRPVDLGFTTVGMRASVGVAVARPGMSADDLVAEADAAMYRAKQDPQLGPVLAVEPQ